jgi:hypothetical protein
MKLLCKHCKKEMDQTHKGATLRPNKRGFWFVCNNNSAMNHEPMDNLDYIEWLAKRKGLVV